ncbi:hypothetical protein BFW01_g5958 [Lasiodiplodia theobromae]|nr:hypothetical protein BFW01_g5958 [Lasiodiplodia theobromae]
MQSNPSKRHLDDEETDEPVQKRQRLHDVSGSQTAGASSSSSQMVGTSTTPTMMGDPAQNANNDLNSSLSQQGSSSFSPAFPQHAVASISSNMATQHANPPTVPLAQPFTIGGQQAAVMTDGIQGLPAPVHPGLIFCGLNQNARSFFESRVSAPFDPTRQQKYPPYAHLSHEAHIPTALHAQQYRAAIWERSPVYHDPTLPTVRANDAYNAERWYTAAIDLTQMRDNLGGKGKGASRFIELADNGQPHYKPEELIGLYFKFMDVVNDGTQYGFRVSTNTRHQKLVRKRKNQMMTAHDRLEAALQAIRHEKGIFGDLLGADGDGNLVEFAYDPRAYADVKNEDRRANLNRGVDKDQRKKPDAPDSFPWSEMAAEKRRACVYSAWSDVPAAERITTPAAAHAFFQSTAQRSTPRGTDPTLDHFYRNLDYFARMLYDSVVSSCGMQDTPTSNQAKAFTSAAPEFKTGDYEREIRNVQAWCYRVCEMLAEGAAYGYLMPQTDGQTPFESSRHPHCTVSQIFFGEQGRNVTVFQRFGAVQMALVCSKAIASPFRGEVEAFLRLRDLIWEPLAYLETKVQHRKSNVKRKAPGMPRNNGAGDNGEGSSSGAKRRRASRPAENQHVTSSAEPHHNANNPAAQPQTNPTAAPPYPASDPHSAAQPHNSAMPATQPGAAPRSSAVDPFDDTRSRSLANHPEAPQDEQGGNTADADAADSSSNASDSDDDMADARSDCSDPQEAEWADLIYSGVKPRRALQLVYPEDYARMVAAEEARAEAVAKGYIAPHYPTYPYPGLPQTDVDGSTFAPDHHQPPTSLPNQQPPVFPNDANNSGGWPGSGGPDMAAAANVDPEAQRERTTFHQAAGGTEWPSWLDPRLEDGSVSGAANTVPPSLPEVAPAQHQPQPFEGSEEDEPHEMDCDYDYGAGDGTAAAVDGASTVAAGTPASGAYTPATDYSDPNFGFK